MRMAVRGWKLLIHAKTAEETSHKISVLPDDSKVMSGFGGVVVPVVAKEEYDTLMKLLKESQDCARTQLAQINNLKMDVGVWKERATTSEGIILKLWEKISKLQLEINLLKNQLKDVK